MAEAIEGAASRLVIALGRITADAQALAAMGAPCQHLQARIELSAMLAKQLLLLLELKALRLHALKTSAQLAGEVIGKARRK